MWDGVMASAQHAEQPPLWSALMAAARIARAHDLPAADRPARRMGGARPVGAPQTLSNRRASPFQLQAAPAKQRRQHSCPQRRGDVGAACRFRDPSRQQAAEPVVAAVKAPAVLAPAVAQAPEAAAAVEAEAAAAAEALLDEPPTPRRMPVLPQRQWTMEGALSGMIDDVHVAAALVAPPAGDCCGRAPSHVPLDIVAEGVEEVCATKGEDAVPLASGEDSALFASGMALILGQMSPGSASQLADARLFLHGFAAPPREAAGGAAAQACSWPASSSLEGGWLVPGASLGRRMRPDDAGHLQTARSFLSGF